MFFDQPTAVLTRPQTRRGRPYGAAPGVRTQELTLPAEAAQLRTARGFADAAGEEFGLDEDGRYRFKLAVSEAVANAIEHGTPCEGTVLLRITSGPDELSFEVHDCGGFSVDWSRRDPLSERGRGLPLMAALVDEVDLKPGPGGTVVRLALERV